MDYGHRPDRGDRRECGYLAHLREYDVMLCVGKDSAKDLAGMNYAATCRRNMQILIGI